MKKSKRLELYYNLFALIVEDPFIAPGKMASILGRTGRGRSPSTLVYHLDQMYEKKISYKPKLKLKPFENTFYTAYLCHKDDMKNTFSTFHDLYEDKYVLYIMMLSGADYFLVSRNANLDLEKYGLEITKKSTFYKEIYTLPKGWKSSHQETITNVLTSGFQKGKLERSFYGVLNWTDTDWLIYEIMKENMRRRDFTKTAKKAGVAFKTAKRHFKESVLPKCSVAHYFFPEGYDNYRYIFSRIKSDFEISLVESFSKLPCTTYVYPLDDEIDVIIFYESHHHILEMFKKLNEIGIIDAYLIYIPIIHGSD